ncbi:hypothetical protein ACFL60_09820, partial [Candidatus Omnitrophota bacterium]
QEISASNPQPQQTLFNNTEVRDDTGDTFTQSPEAERLQELNGRREELQSEIATNEQIRNDQDANFARGEEISREIDTIDREIRNIERPENDAANRAQREALNTYSEQNQAVVRTRNITQGVTNPTGE